MLRVTLTLVPRGDERASRELGTIELENISTTEPGEQRADYAVRARGFLHLDATLRDVARSGGWRLVEQARERRSTRFTPSHRASR